MDLRHLRYFIAVAEEQNVTHAAARLNVSQPSLSRQIRDLEEALGVALFERTAKAIRLTHAGRLFLDEARAVLRRADEAVLAVKAAAHGDRGELRVGYAPFLTMEIVPRALRNFQESHPGVQVKLCDLSTQEMAGGLRERTLDIALLVDVAASVLPDCEFVELRSYSVRAAVSSTHRLARLRKIGPSQLASEKLIAFKRADYPEYDSWLASMFSPLGRTPMIAEEHDGATSLIASVEAGRGVALVADPFKGFVGPRVKLIPFSAAPLVVGAAFLKGATTSKHAEYFLTALKLASESSDVSKKRELGSPPR